jgi:hypothetical protein
LNIIYQECVQVQILTAEFAWNLWNFVKMGFLSKLAVRKII